MQEIRDVAGAVRRYSKIARRDLHASEATAISYAGVWLLLALHAPFVTDCAKLVDVLGMSGADAYKLANQLVSHPHPTVAAAVGGWLGDGVEWRDDLSVPLAALPGQCDLDEWASVGSRGLIETFPIGAGADLVFATALVATPRWLDTMTIAADGCLIMKAGVSPNQQTIVDTDSAGPVAVAIPRSSDGVDVMSVIAAPDISASDVWSAVDEVVELLISSDLPWFELPPGTEHGGHAWTVKTEIRRMAGWFDDIPDWTSRLPLWSAEAAIDLVDAPGIPLLIESMAAKLEKPTLQCWVSQLLAAAYDEAGFAAAAITAMEMERGSPHYVDRTVQVVEADFLRPHALVAVGRGGLWDGIPLFHSWVTPDLWSSLPA